jgi:hypothetical protein
VHAHFEKLNIQVRYKKEWGGRGEEEKNEEKRGGGVEVGLKSLSKHA